MNLSLSGKKVTVVGLGRSGLSAALMLHQLGAKVKVSDCSDTKELRLNVRLLKSKDVDVELGKHSENFILDSSLLVLSPGIPKDLPLLLQADNRKIPVISEIELAYQYCPAPIVAVTGTNGKTTVTTLLGDILSNDGREVVVC